MLWPQEALKGICFDANGMPLSRQQLIELIGEEQIDDDNPRV